MIPAAPTLMAEVCAPTCAMSNSGALHARLRMLWCSDTQYRRYPAASTVWAMLTAPAMDEAALSPYSIPTKSSTARGSDCSCELPQSSKSRDRPGIPARGRRSVPGNLPDRDRRRQSGGETRLSLKVAQVNRLGRPPSRLPGRHGDLPADIKLPQRGSQPVPGQLDRRLLARPHPHERRRPPVPGHHQELLLLGGTEHL